MRHNPLHTMHEQAEAAFLNYGSDLQIVESYGEIEAEYAAIRKGVGMMDSPHRVVIVITGKDRLSFLNNMVTNDTSKLAAGQGQYAYLLNNRGRIVADLNILHAEDATLLELDARLGGEIAGMLEKYHFTEDVTIIDATEQLGRFTLIGRDAATLLNKIVDGNVNQLQAPLQHFRRTIAKAMVTIFRNDQCGETQYELIVPADQLAQIWQVLHEAGGEHVDESGVHLRAIGWAAYNTARIEHGTPLYGIDITDNHLPMETGHWYPKAVSVTKGCYLGQEIVARMHAHKAVSRMLVALRCEGKRLPMAATDIRDPGNILQIGMITSSCISPMLGETPIALGYVKAHLAEVGKELEVLAEGVPVSAKVCAVPFWSRSNS